MRAHLLLVLVALASACGRTSNAPADAQPTPAAAPSTVIAPPRPVVEAGTASHRLILPCRVMAASGTPRIAMDGGAPTPLAIEGFANGWITLGASDTLTVTLPKTSRELAFVGPAVLDPCVGADEAWLARGRFQGSRGTGESPGAEQWVVTPFGVVRYGTAILEVEVDDGGVRASLKVGSATILPEGATTWELLGTTAPRVVKGAPLGKAGSAASADRCAKALAAAKVLEDALVLPGAAGSPTFGDLAMRANDAHVLGRAACAVAKLRADPSAVAPAATPAPTRVPPDR